MRVVGENELGGRSWFKQGVAWLLRFPIINHLAALFARSFLPMRLAQRVPVTQPLVTFRDFGVEVLLHDPFRDQVARSIYWGGGTLPSPADRHVLEMLVKLCRDADLFLDIGAYSGLFALIAAKSNPRLKAVTYEIVPDNHQLIMRNIIANDCVLQVTPKLLGLAASRGAITIPMSVGYKNLALPSSISVGTRFSTGIQIPMHTLDEETAEVTGKVVMKVDVEGFEVDVLNGGRHLITRLRPDIICEILKRAPDLRDIGMFLKSLGYRFYVFTAAGPVEQDYLSFTPKGRDWLLTTDHNLS